MSGMMPKKLQSSHRELWYIVLVYAWKSTRYSYSHEYTRILAGTGTVQVQTQVECVRELLVVRQDTFVPRIMQLPGAVEC